MKVESTARRTALCHGAKIAIAETGLNFFPSLPVGAKLVRNIPCACTCRIQTIMRFSRKFQVHSSGYNRRERYLVNERIIMQSGDEEKIPSDIKAGIEKNNAR